MSDKHCKNQENKLLLYIMISRETWWNKNTDGPKIHIYDIMNEHPGRFRMGLKQRDPPINYPNWSTTTPPGKYQNIHILPESYDTTKQT